MNKLAFRHTPVLCPRFHGGCFTILAVGIAFLLVIFAPTIHAQTEAQSDTDDDNLAYVTQDNQLMLYDPRTRTETKLLDNVQGFIIGRDGRVAFRKLDETDKDIYLFDPATPELDPVNISQNPNGNNYPLAWSPDGRYLAFGSYIQDIDDYSLYVWDGKTTTNIMPDDRLDTADGFYVDWSHDGRLAFTVQYGWTNLDIPPEIYVWDGTTTTNLSQNPEGYDSAARWSSAGQLLFGSQRDGEGYMYIWDGASFKDGSPDVGSFIPIAPELKLISARWAEDCLITFAVGPESSPSGKKDIILWNPESESIVKEFPISSENADSWLAEGGQVVLSSHLASGHPSYYLDVENTKG